MAVRLVSEESTKDLDGEKVSRKYLVDFETVVGCKAARAAVGISLNDAYIGLDGVSDDDLLCISIKSSLRSESPKVWDVTVEYSDDPGEWVAPEEDDNPLLRDPVIRWGFIEGTETYFVDTEDKRVVNAAGDTFDQIPEREAATLFVQIVRNESSYDPTLAMQYANAVNASGFVVDGKSIPAGAAKMSPITGEPKTEGEYEYFEVTYTIKFREEGWKQYFENAGYNALNDEGKLYRIRDQKGQEIVKPRALNSDGTAKDEGAEPDEPLEFTPYYERSFGIFSFN